MLNRLKFDVGVIAEEILDQIPETLFVSSTTTFLDPAMGGGQFLKAVISRLRKYGHSDENISNRVFGYESNKMRVNFAKKQCDYIGVFEAKNFLEEDMSKKFDVIVGNPPYADSQKKGSYNSLWDKFVVKSLTMVTDNGQVAMVTPKTWFTQPRLNDGNAIVKVKRAIETRAVVVVTEDLEKHFPTVGSTFSYYVIAATPQEFTILNGKKIYTSDIAESLKSYDQVIIEKLQLFDCFEKSQLASGGKSLSITLNETHKYKTIVSQNRVDYSDRKSKYHDVKKAVFLVRTAFNYPVLDPIGEMSPPAGSVAAVYCFETADEVEAFGKLFNKKLYKFLIQKQRKHHGFLSMLTVSKIPKVDLTRNWTDNELYSYFNLTQTEIDYIEKNVK